MIYYFLWVRKEKKTENLLSSKQGSQAYSNTGKLTSLQLTMSELLSFESVVNDS